ncbi:Na+/H+-dicarboxylate symporter [Melghirimyces thermohalophilus]|uniref:Na+/H+-dicarboxylate symporter n=1 Tax=Melghirimyces thermohalophilus TaxID=1236220 RepID=A0A1G6NMB5_9BACL|nr:dicarboxylate/amino acid:cation symporter [Melghirimyces thermohalophilus]SDC68437.1 Na+/H+-dicarboxylate symporter [Melghirimyces thermohalophilus]
MGWIRSYRFPLLLLSAILIGSVIGLIWGPRSAVLKPLGDIFLNLMFVAVVPLVFVTISSSITNMSSLKRLGRIMGGMLLIFAVTGLIASLLMLVSVKLFNPAESVHIPLEAQGDMKEVTLGEQLVQTVTAPDFRDLLSKERMLALILMAALFGIAVSQTGEKGIPVARGLSALSQVLIQWVGLILWYAPIGLGAYFAALVGEFGPQLVGSYARAVLVYYPVALLYFALFFTLYAWIAGGKEGVRRFWGVILSPAVTALATGSSVATIPANLTASAQLGISKEVRDVVVPVGATIHMDGSCLSAILKISFLFGLFHLPFEGIGTYLTAIGIALLSGMVMSGVTGGGFIGEMLIVTMYGFPPEALPVLAVLGTVVDPPATMVNASGDTVSGMLLSRWTEGKGWMDRERIRTL